MEKCRLTCLNKGPWYDLKKHGDKLCTLQAAKENQLINYLTELQLRQKVVSKELTQRKVTTVQQHLENITLLIHFC